MTTTFLLLTTEDEMAEIVRRTCGSELELDSTTETVMVRSVQWGRGTTCRNERERDVC